MRQVGAALSADRTRPARRLGKFTTVDESRARASWAGGFSSWLLQSYRVAMIDSSRRFPFNSPEAETRRSEIACRLPTFLFLQRHICI